VGYINKQHRIVYDVLPNSDNLLDENDTPYKGIVKIIRMWTHYE
jgi:Txe/YoeB family toxin of Txe-Axe toxin-antitoxin module